MPILTIEQQATIKGVLDKGETAHRQAHALLEADKHPVEIAIEHGEALAYLHKHGAEP